MNRIKSFYVNTPTHIDKTRNPLKQDKVPKYMEKL